MILSSEVPKHHEYNSENYRWIYILCRECLNIYWIHGSLTQYFDEEEYSTIQNYRIRYTSCPECDGRIELKHITPKYYLTSTRSSYLRRIINDIFRLVINSWEYNANMKEFITPNDIEYYIRR